MNVIVTSSPKKIYSLWNTADPENVEVAAKLTPEIMEKIETIMKTKPAAPEF